MGDATWKAIERKICAKFGGKRSGPTGKMGPDCVETAPFALQIKHRKNVPQWLTDAHVQCLNDAPRGTLPLLVLHPKGWAIGESLIVIRLATFIEWYV